MQSSKIFDSENVILIDEIDKLSDEEQSQMLHAMSNEDLEKITLAQQRREFLEEKKERKLDAYNRIIRNAVQEKTSRQNTVDTICDAIPFGQPILVGHHSEKRHRRDIDKIHSNMDKIVELGHKVEHYEDKIDNLENSHVISSDDPDAIIKLKAKVAAIDKEIERIKAHNKLCNQIHLSLYEFANGIHISNDNGNYSTYAVVSGKSIEWKMKRVPKDIKKIIEDYAETGILKQKELSEDKRKLPAYHLQNLHSNKSRILERIEHLEKVEKIPVINESNNGISLEVDRIENRVKLFFPGKPSDEIRTKLKSHGWHWSPRNVCWQKMLNACNIEEGREFLK